MNSYYEDDFKGTNSMLIVSKRTATEKNPGCLIHLHEYVEFYYVLSGGVKVFCDGASDWVRAKELAFINWCQPHRSLEFANDTVYYIVQFNLNALTYANDDVFQKKFIPKLINDVQTFKPFIKNDKTLTDYFDLLLNEYEGQRYACELTVRAAVYNILAHILRSAQSNKTNSDNNGVFSSSADYSKKIIQYLYINYQKDICLDDMSKMLGISVSYMCRMFKQYTGMTIIDFLNRLRCKKAMSLIRDGMSILQASELSGFNDYTYFSRVFKKLHGSSPTKSIKQAF